MATRKKPEASRTHTRQATFLKNRQIRHLVQGKSLEAEGLPDWDADLDI